MKAVTIFQPWAQLIAERRVKVTTKEWPMEHRGLLAIHAANRVNGDKAVEFGYDPEKLIQGAVIAIVNVKDCVALPSPRIRDSKFESKFVDEYGIEHRSREPGRYAILFDVVHKLKKPIPMKGKMKVWDLPIDYGDISKLQV